MDGPWLIDFGNFYIKREFSSHSHFPQRLTLNF
jgi:hypothetical protein